MRYRDLRNLPAEELASVSHDEIVVTAWQLSAVPSLLSRKNVLVTVPDFLAYGRMINTGQAANIIKLPGSLPRAAMSGINASRAMMYHPAKAAKTDFWVFAEAMLRYDISLLPGKFNGSVLLHSYLADFAFVFERGDFVRTFFRLCGKDVRAGIHTQQLPLALSCLARWAVKPAAISFLYSPNSPDDDLIISAKEADAFRSTLFIPDASSLPGELQGELPTNNAIVSLGKS